MLKIFFGDDRPKTQTEIERQLGKDYEVFEGESLTLSDLPSIFRGTSLLAENRKILLKDFSANEELWEKFADQNLSTSYDIILWESNLDQRTLIYKSLKSKNIEMRNFPKPKTYESNRAFNILDVAYKDGPRAVKLLEEIEADQDPIRFLGLLAYQAIKAYDAHPGPKEKRVLRELSKLDIELKSLPTSLQPWLLLKSFLLRVSSL